MIVKNEEANLAACLNSIKGVVDEIVIVDTGSTDGTVAIAESFGAVVHKFDWIDDFSAARQFSFSKCSNDLVFWIDADDILVNSHLFRKSLEHFDNERVGAIFFVYQYAFDKDGNCITEHWRERVVRKDWYSWSGPVHENLLPLREGTNVKITDIWIKHRKKESDIAASNERNLRILEKEIEKTKPFVDPRILFGLAQAYQADNRLEEANDVFRKYIECSGWDEEKYIAQYTIGENFWRMGKLKEATDAHFDAMKILPLRPDAYFGMARVAHKSEQWENVLYWCEEGFRRGRPQGMCIYNPRNYDLNPLMLLCNAYFNLARYKECQLAIVKILKYKPNDQSFIEMGQICQQYIEDLELIGCVEKIKKDLKLGGENEKIYHLAKAVPNTVSDIPSLRPYLQRGPEPTKRIYIYCGPTHEMWSPAKEKTGIGGSEEAVINMSRHWRDMGWNVVVFNMCDEVDDKDWDGVRYTGYWQCKKEFVPDVFIYWRNSAFLDSGFSGHQTYLWMHDLQRPEYWWKERWEKVDKIIALSQWHRRNVSQIPDDRMWVSRNGIEPSHFDHLVDRDPFRCFYGSSPDRGLDILLECWPEIMAAVPQANLHVYYGFTKTFDAMHHNNKFMMSWKEKVQTMLRQPGVTYHGRVGHKEVAKAMMQASLWTYPTNFKEISCISAMKAQAAGAFPICTKLAALDETVQFGCKIDSSVDEPDIQNPEKRKLFTQAVIRALLDPQPESARQSMSKWALDHYSWKSVASEWNDVFTGGAKTKNGLCLSRSV